MQLSQSLVDFARLARNKPAKSRKHAKGCRGKDLPVRA